MPESHDQPARNPAPPLTMRTSLRTSPLLLCGLLLGLLAVQAAEQQATQSFTYKRAKQTDLELIVHYLRPRENGAKRPVGQEDGSSFTIETNKPEDRVEMKGEGDSATLVVFSQSGIGRATITTTSGNWPKTVILRLHLAGLEHLAISAGKVQLTGSVLSHSGYTARLCLTEDECGEERELETAIRVFDANGKPAAGLPGKGGHFEITLPKTLLTNQPRRLELEWIDFYRE